MFIVPEDGESRESFLTRVEQAAKLLGGRSLYSLVHGKSPANEKDHVYEWAEARSVDCGRDDSGRFGPKNDCASDDGASVSGAPKAGATKPDKWGEYFSEDSPPERPRVYGEDGKEAKGVAVSDAIQKRYEEAVSRWAYGMGVRFNRGLYSHEGSRTVDAAEALVRGLSFAASVGDRIPSEVAIGRMASRTALAEWERATDRIIINRELDAARVESAMKTGWLSGDASRPLESLFLHELTHSLHFDSLNLNAERWENMTGLPEMDRLREEAVAAGRQFRPAAGLLESFAWSQKHRVSSTAGPLTPDQAMSVAKEVSGYAASSPLEFVAEFRVGVLMGKKYSDAAWSLYDDYGGPKIPRRSE